MVVEVDFAPVPVTGVTGSQVTVPVEVKWVSSGWRQAARALERRYGRGVVATKTVTDCGGTVWAVPVPTLSLLLG